MPNPLAESFRYSRRANLRLVDACRALPEEHLDAPAPVAYGTIRRALQHLVGGEQTQVLRTKGRQDEGELSPHHYWPGWEKLAQLCRNADDELVAIADSMTVDETVVLPYRGLRPVFPKSFFLAHALGHSAEHRTQVSIAMTLMGVEPPNLDGWAYAAAVGYGATGT